MTNPVKTIFPYAPGQYWKNKAYRSSDSQRKDLISRWNLRSSKNIFSTKYISGISLADRPSDRGHVITFRYAALGDPINKAVSDIIFDSMEPAGFYSELYDNHLLHYLTTIPFIPYEVLNTITPVDGPIIKIPKGKYISVGTQSRRDRVVSSFDRAETTNISAINIKETEEGIKTSTFRFPNDF